ncbi:hypothetical protein ACQ4PT_014293 [Festuca glaucescens]
MDAGLPPMQEEEDPPARDWSLLPIDVLVSVFARVGAVDVLMGAGLVCHSWLQAAKLPDVWRVVDMQEVEVVLSEEVLFRDHWMPLYEYLDVLRAMAKTAVDRSGGQLREFVGNEFVTDELIQYIVERSPLLTTLRLVSCRSNSFSKRLAGVIRESPLSELRSLELDFVDICVDELTTILENCPALELLKLSSCLEIHDEDEHALRAKFTGIKSLTVERADFSDSGSDIHGDPWRF